MAGIIIAAVLLIGVIVLTIWLTLGRGAFGPDTGPDDDNAEWFTRMGD